MEILDDFHEFLSSYSSQLSYSSRLRHYFMASGLRELFPHERFTNCHRVPFGFLGRSGKRVGVWERSQDSDGNALGSQGSLLGNGTDSQREAFYRSLLLCGSVWACPFCAPYISSYRRQELDKLLNFWRFQNPPRKVLFITYTLPHYSFQSCEDVGSMLLDAMRSFLKSGSVSVYRKKNFYATARVLEVKYGKNGWHPHIHELVMFNEYATDPAIPYELYKRFEDEIHTLVKNSLFKHWQSALERTAKGYGWSLPTQGLERSLDVRGGDFAAAYIAKFGHEPVTSTWESSLELSKSHLILSKTPRPSRTPFQLLLDYCLGEEHSGKLFVEYFKFFKGRKQFVWTPRDIRKKLALTDLEDEEIVLQQEVDLFPKHLGTFNIYNWNKIVDSNSRHAFLTAVEKFGFDQALEVFGLDTTDVVPLPHFEEAEIPY